MGSQRVGHDWATFTSIHFILTRIYQGLFWLPRWHSGKESTCQCPRHKRLGFDPRVRKIPWQPTPAFLPREFQGQRSLTGYSPWGHKKSDTTEHACSQVVGLLGHTPWWYGTAAVNFSHKILSHRLVSFHELHYHNWILYILYLLRSL